MRNNIIVITGVVILAAAGTWWLTTQMDQMTQVPSGDIYTPPKAPEIPAAMKTWKRVDMGKWPKGPEIITPTEKAEIIGMDLPEKADLKDYAEKDGVVYFTDYANRCVWAFDKGTKKRTKFAEGFVVPSPYFPIAAGKEYIWIVNPGEHRIEPYWPNGDVNREKIWGALGAGLAAFPGCCNPSFMRIFPDGRFVVAQKGIPMVKVYNDEGKLDSVVEGPDDFMSNLQISDLRISPDGRQVLVLVAGGGEWWRIYEPKKK